MFARRAIWNRSPSYLRVVVTGKCPLTCPYCHAEGDATSVSNARRSSGLPRDILAACFEVAQRVGIRKVKLLGGEPLARPDLPLVISDLRTRIPDADISIVTSGVLDACRLEAAFDAGLDRVNLSIHGWTMDAFVRRGGRKDLHSVRTRVLRWMLDSGQQPKLNYVYSSSEDNPDLNQILTWAASHSLVVNVLDDLRDPGASVGRLKEVLNRLRGPWYRQELDPDPRSLDATHLSWLDGLVVEIKHHRLGAVAPWRHCAFCAKRERCREGIFALRIVSGGDLRLCMDRSDLRLPIASLVRNERIGEATLAWKQFIERNLSAHPDASVTVWGHI